jgi:hypothetical protein
MPFKMEKAILFHSQFNLIKNSLQFGTAKNIGLLSSHLPAMASSMEMAMSIFHPSLFPWLKLDPRQV